MRHMGNSGKIAIAAALAALGMLVLTALTLEESVMFTFLGLVAVAYVAAVSEVFALGRHVAVLAGGVGTSLTIGFSIAFLRMWGLAFNQDPAAVGTAVTTKDSDIYFYLAATSAAATLLVLFAGVVWPAGKRRPSASRRKVPARRRPSSPSRRPARTGTKAASGAQRSTGQRTSAQRASAQRTSGSRTPAARVPPVEAKRPSSSASPVRKPAPATTSKPTPKAASKPGAKAASRR
ncbi:hypothetical protein QFZ30_003442 [Arthrobacter pascens]|nr:hypothetical protein [Arthrobacter pascens]